LIVRRGAHKSNCNNEKDKKYNFNVYQFIRENGGFQNWDVVMHEQLVDCNDKETLRKRERFYIASLKAELNKVIPTRTQKEYRKNNKKKIAEYDKEYRENNMEKIAEYQRENKDKISERKKCYHKQNKIKIKEYQKLYRANKKIFEKRIQEHFFILYIYKEILIHNGI
jgi:hypothetical protein